MFAKPNTEIVFLSFLQQVKKSGNKTYFLVLFVFAVQLCFTFIKLEAIPFFLYGMYSEKTAATDTFAVATILINGKSIDKYSVSFREKSLLETNLENYEIIKKNNYEDPVKTRIDARYPLIYKSFLYPLISKHIYNTPNAQMKFRTWFKQKCLSVTGADTGEVKIWQTTFYLDRKNISFKQIKNELLEQF